MPSLPQSTPPPWDESASFRETTLYLLNDPAGREAVRHAGRVLHDLALEANREQPGEESATRAELRAAAADLRYTSGYLHNVICLSAEWCSLPKSEEKLARFAGKLSRQVAALVDKIERRLS